MSSICIQVSQRIIIVFHIGFPLSDSLFGVNWRHKNMCDHLFMLQNDVVFFFPPLKWWFEECKPMTSLKAFTQEPSSRLAIQWQTSHGSLGKTPGRGHLCDTTLVVTPDPGMCHYSTLSGHRACKELGPMKMFVCASSTNIQQTVLHEFASIHI